MENNEKCVILSKKEYDELRSRSNIPGLKIVVDFGYRWRGVGIHVSGTSDPSEKLYCQIRRICMASDDGYDWRLGNFRDGHAAYLPDESGDTVTYRHWNYVVPVSKFNFEDLQSNILDALQ